MEFKVNDKVEVIESITWLGIELIGKRGTVIKKEEDDETLLIEFDDYVSGHDGDIPGKSNCLWLMKDQVKKVVEKPNEVEIIVKYDGKTNILRGNGFIGVLFEEDGKAGTFATRLTLAELSYAANSITAESIKRIIKGNEVE